MARSCSGRDRAQRASHLADSPSSGHLRDGTARARSFPFRPPPTHVAAGFRRDRPADREPVMGWERRAEGARRRRSRGSSMQPVTSPVGRPLVTAVTGTNGKTSVATATLQLLRAAGLRAAGCDSTGLTDVDGRVRPANFRRSAQFLPDLIAEQVALGAEAISLEAFVGILKDGLLT